MYVSLRWWHTYLWFLSTIGIAAASDLHCCMHWWCRGVDPAKTSPSAATVTASYWYRLYLASLCRSRSRDLHWLWRLDANPFNPCHKDYVSLFCNAASTTEHLSVTVEARSPVARVVTCFVLTGLQQLDPCWHPSTSSSAAPIRDECSCSADFSIVKIRPRHSGSSSTPLAEGSWMDWLQTHRSRIQMPAWVGTAVPHRQTLLTSWSWGSTATALGLVFITDCLPNSTVHRRRSSLPGRRCSCLEQSATARHFCAFSSRLCISAENPLLLCFLSRTVLSVQVWSDFVIIRHSNQLSYLLTYLHVARCAVNSQHVLAELIGWRICLSVCLSSVNFYLPCFFSASINLMLMKLGMNDRRMIEEL